jgi:hypothetical protein
MREAEGSATEETERPAARVRDHLTRYGQLLFRHKQENISGLYPMKNPEHLRIMIVSHVLMHVTLLDPLGDDFTEQEITHVACGLEGTKSIDEVIQEGLSAKNILDTNTYPYGRAHNENIILQSRKSFQLMIYAESHPICLTEWLDDWSTPISLMSPAFTPHGTQLAPCPLNSHHTALTT